MSETMQPHYVGEGVNEHGTAVSLFVCVVCGVDFSVCPAVDEENHGDWAACMTERYCSSYEPTRDAELYFGIGMVERGK